MNTLLSIKLPNKKVCRSWYELLQTIKKQPMKKETTLIPHLDKCLKIAYPHSVMVYYSN